MHQKSRPLAVALAIALLLALNAFAQSACAAPIPPTQSAAVSPASGGTPESAPSPAASSEPPAPVPPVRTLVTPLFGKFSTTDIDGNPVDQSILEGYDLTMVNIWATYCGPCVQELPDLQALSEEYGDEGFQIIGIALDTTDLDYAISEEKVANSRRFLEEAGVTYLQLLPSDDLRKSALGLIYAVPETYLVDREGNARWIYTGSKSREDWRRIIEEKLAEVRK